MEKLIYNYFEIKSEDTINRISSLQNLYIKYNQMVNVISRKDIDNLYLHHVLHSLSISKYIDFPKGAKVLDVGTGGGFPGIPLAILNPDVNFTLCDSINKKVKIVESIVNDLKLNNVQTVWKRAESIEDTFDFVVSRAVTDLNQFLPWVWNRVKKGKIGQYDRGFIYLKGGNIEEEIDLLKKTFHLKPSQIHIEEISKWYKEEFFIQKLLIFIER